MEIDTKPAKLKEQEKKPGLVPFMQKATEENINRQLDKAWKKDDDEGKLNEVEREPTEVVKTSEADFYALVGDILDRKRLERKLKE